MARPRAFSVTLLTLLGSAACAAPPDDVIDVWVHGGDDRVAQLQIQLRGAATESDVKPVLEGLTHLRLRPQGDARRFQGSLVVYGLGRNGCTVLEGSVVVDVPGLLARPAPVNVTLVAPAQPACQLVIEPVGNGEGRVTSEPVATADGLVMPINCPPLCQTMLPPDTVVALHGQPAAGSAFHSWASQRLPTAVDPSTACHGAGTCVVTVNATNAARVFARFIPSPVCVLDGQFCWENPLWGGPINGLWGSGPSDLWAVGESEGTGLVAHFDGSVWRAVRNGARFPLRAVWGSSAADVWAVGDHGQILHYGGGDWLLQAGGNPGAALMSLVGSGSGDVWAGGTSGVLLHFDGAAWRPAPSGTPDDITSLWGDRAGALWAVAGGALLHRDPGTGPLLRTNLDAAQQVNRVFGDERGGLWAAGAQGTIWQGSGAIFSPVFSWMHDTNALSAVGGGGGEVWFLGAADTALRWDGLGFASAVTPAPPELMVQALWGSSVRDLWAAGDSGLLLGWDGANWRSRAPLPGDALRALWGTNTADVWAVGARGRVLHWDGARWSATRIDSGDLSAVWGSGPRDVWAAGLAAGRGAALWRWDGASWSATKFPDIHGLHALWGSSAHDVWAGGVDGALLHFDGAGWTKQTLPARDINALWGLSADQVFAAGEDPDGGGILLQRLAGRWQRVVAAESSLPLFTMWASSATDVWAGGTSRLLDSQLYHFDGVQWRPVPLALHPFFTITRIFAPKGQSEPFVLARGPGPATQLLQKKGDTFVPVGEPVSNALYDLWGTDADNLWLVGDFGALLRRHSP